jgi:hypothetical protein
MCNCKNLYSCVESLNELKFNDISFTYLEEDIHNWRQLHRCNECQQLWIVEHGNESDRRHNLCYKIANEDRWKENNLNHHYLDFIARINGGVSDEKCIYLNCNYNALSKMKICAFHFSSRNAR